MLKSSVYAKPLFKKNSPMMFYLNFLSSKKFNTGPPSAPNAGQVSAVPPKTKEQLKVEGFENYSKFFKKQRYEKYINK
jgi:hypothetical protein